MANTQQLNPSGYLINNDPKNINPFFSWDDSSDPTLAGRVQVLENNVDELIEDVEDLEREAGRQSQEIANINSDISHIGSELTDIDIRLDDTATKEELGQGLSNLNSGIQQQIGSVQSNFNNYYTKSQTYTRQEIDNKIPSIPSLDNYYTKQQTYNRQEIDNKIPDLNNYYTKTIIDAKEELLMDNINTIYDEITRIDETIGDAVSRLEVI